VQSVCEYPLQTMHLTLLSIIEIQLNATVFDISYRLSLTLNKFNILYNNFKYIYFFSITQTTLESSPNLNYFSITLRFTRTISIVLHRIPAVSRLRRDVISFTNYLDGHKNVCSYESIRIV